MFAVENVWIRPAQETDLDQLAHLSRALWPDCSAQEHAQELRLKLGGKPDSIPTKPLTIFVAERSDRILVGFLEVGLRSHADGCNPLRPVGYLEGWYVADEHRHRGIGKELVANAEDWATRSRVLRDGFRCDHRQ